SSAKPQRDLRLVALFEESPQVAQLHCVIAFVGAGPELHFLDLDDLLLEPGVVLPLLLLVLELAVVHQAADGGNRLRCDLDQVDLGLFGHAHGLPQADDADRLVLNAYEPHLGHVDLAVDAMRAFSCSDAQISCTKTNTTAVQRHRPARRHAPPCGARPARRSLRDGSLQRDVFGQPRRERPDVESAQIGPPARAHGHLASLPLLVADDQEIRDLLQAAFADSIVDFLVPQIGLDPKPLFSQRFGNRRRVLPLGVGDVHHDRLHGGQPHRQRTGVVLDQDADEALERADNGPVQHDRYAPRVVLGDVFGAQPAGHVEVDLHRSALPLATDRVLQRVFDLRAVESPLAGRNLELAPGAAQALHQGRLGPVPGFVGADALLRPRGHLVQDLLETEVAIDRLQLGGERDAFVEDLLLGTEHVAVVLREPADPHDPVQRARRLVAVALPELAV